MMIASWVLRILVALILLQTLYFKFSGAAESVAIFTKLGVEPWGRFLTGVLELFAACLLFVPGFSVYGALLACALMFGAIASHLFVLGIQSNHDKGLLFGLAVLVLVLSLVIAYLHRTESDFVMKAFGFIGL